MDTACRARAAKYPLSWTQPLKFMFHCCGPPALYDKDRSLCATRRHHSYPQQWARPGRLRWSCSAGYLASSVDGRCVGFSHARSIYHGIATYRTNILHGIGNGSLHDCASFHLAFEATARLNARVLVHRSSWNCCDTIACIRICAWHGEENVLVLDIHVLRNAEVEYISSSSLHLFYSSRASLARDAELKLHLPQQQSLLPHTEGTKQGPCSD